jgi:hypothetical protein
MDEGGGELKTFSGVLNFKSIYNFIAMPVSSTFVRYID